MERHKSNCDGVLYVLVRPIMTRSIVAYDVFSFQTESVDCTNVRKIIRLTDSWNYDVFLKRRAQYHIIRF